MIPTRSGLAGREPRHAGRLDGPGRAPRRGSRLKLLQWDGTGVWLSQRRLHQGCFRWPNADDRLLTLTQAQWQWLIAGVDWQRLEARPPEHWQV